MEGQLSRRDVPHLDKDAIVGVGGKETRTPRDCLVADCEEGATELLIIVQAQPFAKSLTKGFFGPVKKLFRTAHLYA